MSWWVFASVMFVCGIGLWASADGLALAAFVLTVIAAVEGIKDEDRRSRRAPGRQG